MRAALLSAVLSLLACLPAHAQEAETAALMLCDTQKQVERFVQLFEGNRDAAIRAVNTEAKDPTACGIVNATFVPGNPIGIARTASDGFGIVPVVVIAVHGPTGAQQVRPAVFFTLVKLKERAV